MVSMSHDSAGHVARIDTLLHDARARIDAGDAEHLLTHVLAVSRTWLFMNHRAPVRSADAVRFIALVERRAAGEPVAYLTGRRGFWRFDLAVTPATLIPRPETELLVELALARIPEGRVSCVADLGTGSGAVALALAFERPQAQVVATDVSEAALGVARRNAAALGLHRIDFRRGDWCVPLVGERFDLVVSNPPYIEAEDAHLAQGDLRHEPPGALASGADGLDAIRTLVRAVPAHLRDSGSLLVEHGWQQGGAVRALFAAAGFTGVETARDLEHRERVTLGHMPL